MTHTETRRALALARRELAEILRLAEITGDEGGRADVPGASVFITSARRARLRAVLAALDEENPVSV